MASPEIKHPDLFTNIFQSKKWKKQTPVHFFFVFEKDTMDQADNNLRRDYHSTYQYSNNCKSSKHKHGFTHCLLRFFRHSSRKLWRRHFIKPRTWRWKSSTFPLFRLQKNEYEQNSVSNKYKFLFPFFSQNFAFSWTYSNRLSSNIVIQVLLLLMTLLNNWICRHRRSQ